MNDQDRPLTRDERVLLGLATGRTTSAELATWSGLGERDVRRGLHRLIASGHVFSRQRGTYELTGLGRGLIANLPVRESGVI